VVKVVKKWLLLHFLAVPKVKNMNFTYSRQELGEQVPETGVLKLHLLPSPNFGTKINKPGIQVSSLMEFKIDA
jgi:hypothetical protein